MDLIKGFIADRQTEALIAIAFAFAFVNRNRLFFLSALKANATPKKAEPIADDDLEAFLAISRLMARARKTNNAQLKRHAAECLSCLFVDPEEADSV